MVSFRRSISTKLWLAAWEAEVKLERTRKAAKSELQNKTAELQKNAELEFNRKLAAMNAGGDTALQDALAQVEELSNKLHEMSVKQNAADDLLKDSHHKLRQAEDQAAWLEKRSADMATDAEAVRAALVEAENEIKLSNKDARLSEMTRALVKSMTDGKRQLQEAMAALDATTQENTALKEQEQNLKEQQQTIKAQAVEKELTLKEQIEQLLNAVESAKAQSAQAVEAALKEAQAARDEAAVARTQTAVETVAPPQHMHKRPPTPPPALRPPTPPPPPPPPVGASEAESLTLLQKQYGEIQEQCIELASSLAEVTVGMERTKTMRESDCREHLSDLLARLRGEADERGKKPAHVMVEAQVKRLLAETASLSAARDRLNEQLTMMGEQLSELNADRDRLDAALRAGMKPAETPKVEREMSDAQLQKLKDEMEAVQQQLIRELGEVKGEANAMRSEVQDGRTCLAAGLRRLGLPVDASKVLSDWVALIVEKAAIESGRMESAERELKGALQDLGLKTEENKTLREYVHELSEVAKNAKAELKLAHEEHEKAIRSLGGQQNDIKVLKDLVTALEAKCASSKEANVQLADELEAVKQSAQKAAQQASVATAAVRANLGLQIAQLEHEIAQLRGSSRSYHSDLVSCKALLSDALSEVDTLSSSNMGLGDQVKSLVSKYKACRAILRLMTAELEQALHVMEAALRAKNEAGEELERVETEAEAKMLQIKQGARQERAVLVNAALRSLEILRGHVATSQAGMFGAMQPVHQHSPAILASTTNAPPQHVLSPGKLLQPPPTAELQPRGAIDGLDAETRQWQPRAELPSGAYLGSKGRHRWGIPPEAPALLTSLIESSAQSPRHQRAHHQQLHESAHGNALSPPFSVPSGASDHNVRLPTNLQALVSPRRRRDRDSATGVSLRVQRVLKDGSSTHASVETHVSQTPFSDAVANAERARLAHARAVRDANQERPLGSRSSSRGNSRESSASGTQQAQDGSSAFNRLELSLPPLSEQSATSLPQPAIPPSPPFHAPYVPSPRAPPVRMKAPAPPPSTKTLALEAEPWADDFDF